MLPKNVLRMGHLFFRAFISLANQIMKENIAKTLVKKTHSTAASSFLHHTTCFRTGLFKVAKILTIIPYAANYSFTNNSKFTYTETNVFISRPVVINKL